jgi:hypothetical protein
MPVSRLPALVFALLSASCATVLPPTAVKLAPVAASRPLPAIADLRPADDRVYRESATPSTISKYLGDDVLQPRLLVLLQHQIADALPPSRAGARIALRQADIGYRIAMDAAPPPNVPAISIAIGPINIGALVGAGIAYGMQRAAAPEYAVAYVLLTIDDEVIAAWEEVPVTPEVGGAESVKRAVLAALDTLRERVAVLERPLD